MRVYPKSDRSNALFDFIAARLEMDKTLSAGIAVFIAIGTLLSLAAGIAVWPVVFDLRSVESYLGWLSRHLCIRSTGIMAACVVIVFLLLIWQRSRIRIWRIFVFNTIFLWLAYLALLILQLGAIHMLQVDVFMGTLLWILISFFAGYILSILPAIIVTVVVSVGHGILNLILPE